MELYEHVQNILTTIFLQLILAFLLVIKYRIPFRSLKISCTHQTESNLKIFPSFIHFTCSKLDRGPKCHQPRCRSVFRREHGENHFECGTIFQPGYRISLLWKGWSATVWVNKSYLGRSVAKSVASWWWCDRTEGVCEIWLRS